MSGRVSSSARAFSYIVPTLLKHFALAVESMTDFFYNSAGRLRGVWRLAVFTVAYLAAGTAAFSGTDLALALLLPREAYVWLVVESGWGWVIQSVMLFVPAALIGWGCAYFIEELPWRSLGWALHRGGMRDALFGLVAGGASVCAAALVGAAAGGVKTIVTLE